MNDPVTRRAGTVPRRVCCDGGAGAAAKRGHQIVVRSAGATFGVRLLPASLLLLPREESESKSEEEDHDCHPYEKIFPEIHSCEGQDGSRCEDPHLPVKIRVVPRAGPVEEYRGHRKHICLRSGRGWGRADSAARAAPLQEGTNPVSALFGQASERIHLRTSSDPLLEGGAIEAIQETLRQ